MLNATLNFCYRVKQFIKHIVMSKQNPMAIFTHTRLSFNFEVQHMYMVSYGLSGINALLYLMKMLLMKMIIRWMLTILKMFVRF